MILPPTLPHKKDYHKPRKGDRHKIKNRKGDRHKPRKGDRHKRILSTQTEFLTVDGEATNRLYTLLGCSNGSSLYNPLGLRTIEVFEFLLSQGVKEFWTFAGTYDINNWLKGFSEEHLRKLTGAIRNSVRWGDYTVTHFYNKLFQLTRHSDKRTVRVWDIFPYVTSSFVTWVDKWGLAQSEEEIDYLKRMKGARSSFVEGELEEIKRYNRLELALLQKGVKKFKRLVEDTGYIPSVWYSPGSLAAAAMKKHDVLPHLAREEVPQVINELAKQAYYGGRFEVSRLGLVEGPLYHYDIHSAYPAAMVDLPSLAGARWVRKTLSRFDLDGPELALVDLRWKTRKGCYFGPFPVRLSVGSLRYPLQSEGRGWYWNTEVKPARGIADLTIKQAYVLIPTNEVKPFGYLRELYDLRRELKSKKDPTEYVLKLIVNSSYGKLAQHTSKTGEVPRYQQLIYAGLITSTVRGRLLECIAQCKKDIVFLATDGLVSLCPLPLPLSANLGDWEEEVLDWVFIVQSGIYFWPDKTGKVVQHSRGIGIDRLDYSQVLKSWQDHTPITANENRFIGYRTALQRTFNLFCTWADCPKIINMTTKPRRRDGPRVGDMMLSYPPVTAKLDIFDFDGFNFTNMDNWDYEQPQVTQGDNF